MTRNQIVSIARSYVGTPFHHQGRQKAIGIDCVGLLVCVMRECGLNVEDQTNYNGLIDAGFLRSKLDSHLVELSSPSDKEGWLKAGVVGVGDVLLLRIGKNPQHIGIVSDVGIIHTHQNAGRVIETNLSGWSKRIVSAYSLPEVEI